MVFEEFALVFRESVLHFSLYCSGTYIGGGCDGLQDLQSWTRDGIAGLQSVVLYSLPELDGAIDTVPLGGLVGDNIYLVTERVRRLSDRIKKWVKLRRTPPKVRTLVLRLNAPLRNLLLRCSRSYEVNKRKMVRS